MCYVVCMTLGTKVIPILCAILLSGAADAGVPEPWRVRIEPLVSEGDQIDIDGTLYTFESLQDAPDWFTTGWIDVDGSVIHPFIVTAPDGINTLHIVMRLDPDGNQLVTTEFARPFEGIYGEGERLAYDKAYFAAPLPDGEVAVYSVISGTDPRDAIAMFRDKMPSAVFTDESGLIHPLSYKARNGLINRDNYSLFCRDKVWLNPEITTPYFDKDGNPHPGQLYRRFIFQHDFTKGTSRAVDGYSQYPEDDGLFPLLSRIVAVNQRGEALVLRYMDTSQYLPYKARKLVRVNPDGSQHTVIAQTRSDITYIDPDGSTRTERISQLAAQTYDTDFFALEAHAIISNNGTIVFPVSWGVNATFHPDGYIIDTGKGIPSILPRSAGFLESGEYLYYPNIYKLFFDREDNLYLFGSTYIDENNVGNTIFKRRPDGSLSLLYASGMAAPDLPGMTIRSILRAYAYDDGTVLFEADIQGYANSSATFISDPWGRFRLLGGGGTPAGNDSGNFAELHFPKNRYLRNGGPEIMNDSGDLYLYGESPDGKLTAASIEIESFGCPADMDENGVIDFFDLSMYLRGFGSDPMTDLAEPRFVWDLNDIERFLELVVSQCE